MEHLPLDPVVIPNTFDSGIKWFAGFKVNADGVALRLFILGSQVGWLLGRDYRQTRTCNATTTSWTSNPPLAANVFGMISKASANA